MKKNGIPDKLKQKMDQFNVEVPEITMKRSLSRRIADWMFTSAKNPADYFTKPLTPLGMAMLPLPILLCTVPLLFI
ncbi:hypothetical protein [Gracilibacillus xinjiangensis]|uniref:Uncharacterized protein n=1 Tax=Gracilibacillus xinjiangensis TaxID=1193282 RepID=A0ABV8WQ92_9BACI